VVDSATRAFFHSRFSNPHSVIHYCVFGSFRFLGNQIDPTCHRMSNGLPRGKVPPTNETHIRILESTHKTRVLGSWWIDWSDYWMDLLVVCQSAFFSKDCRSCSRFILCSNWLLFWAKSLWISCQMLPLRSLIQTNPPKR